MTEYFECQPNCAKCCPGGGEIAAPVTIGDLYRFVHFLGGQDNVAGLVMNTGHFDFCMLAKDTVNTFCGEAFLKRGDLLYAIPSLAEPCFMLDMETKKCRSYGQSIKPVHCHVLPERDIAIKLPDEEYFNTKKGKIFGCIKGKKLKEQDFRKIILLNSIAEAERCLTALLFPWVAGVSEGQVIKINEMDEKMGSGFYTQILAQYYNNPERRNLIQNFLRYTTNNFKELIGEPDPVPECYEEPMPDFDISRLANNFDDEQRTGITALISNFTKAFEELKEINQQ